MTVADSFTCQCCGQPVKGAVDPFMLPLSAVRLTVLKTLPAGIEKLAEAVYGTGNLAPADEYATLRVVVSQLRKQLEEHGWTISRGGGRGNPAYYRLVRAGLSEMTSKSA